MDEDDDPYILIEGSIYVNPCRVVESLPPTYDKRLDRFRWRVQMVAMRVCGVGRIDLVEKLLNGRYVRINEQFWGGDTLLGGASSIKMADLLISHGAVFKGRGWKEFDCFKCYIIRCYPYMIKHFFNHHEFIYTDKYMDLAIANDNKPTIDILKRKRDRQRAIITMDELGKRFNTNVFTCLKIDEYL